MMVYACLQVVRETLLAVQSEGLQNQKVGAASAELCKRLMALFRSRELGTMHAHDRFVSELEERNVAQALMVQLSSQWIKWLEDSRANAEAGYHH